MYRVIDTEKRKIIGSHCDAVETAILILNFEGTRHEIREEPESYQRYRLYTCKKNSTVFKKTNIISDNRNRYNATLFIFSFVTMNYITFSHRIVIRRYDHG